MLLIQLVDTFDSGQPSMRYCFHVKFAYTVVFIN